MRQRVAIAIAMLHRPDLIIADEPTTALDVTIQAQILSEVQKLAQQHGTSLIWITHDLSVVAGLADEVAVMYAGRIVEHGTVDDVLDRPQHPYTVGLIDSLPSNNRRGQRLRQIPGMTPNLLNLPLAALRHAARAPAPPVSARPHQRGPARPPRAASTPPSRSGGGGMSGTERQTDAARRDATANPARDAQDATATQGAATPLIELRNISSASANARGRRRPPVAARRLVQAARRDPRRGRRGPDRAPRRSGRPGRRVRLRQFTLGRVAAGLLTPSGGEVRINGLRPADMTPAQAHQARLKVQMIFQDPYASLNPRLRVDEIVGEARASTAWSAGASSTTTSAPSSAPAWTRPCASAIRTSSAAASASASASPARWRCSRPCWSATRPWPRWTVSIQAQILNLFMDLREDLA